MAIASAQSVYMLLSGSEQVRNQGYTSCHLPAGGVATSCKAAAALKTKAATPDAALMGLATYACGVTVVRPSLNTVVSSTLLRACTWRSEARHTALHVARAGLLLVKHCPREDWRREDWVIPVATMLAVWTVACAK